MAFDMGQLHGPWCKRSLYKLCPFKRKFIVVQTWRLACNQCSRLKSLVPFKCNLALQNIPLSKQPFKTQPQIENEDATWSPRYNLHVTKTNKRRTLSLQRSGIRWLILDSSHYTWNMYHMTLYTILVWALYFNSIFLDWRLGFEPTLQPHSWNLRALQNEIHRRASILNVGFHVRPVYMLTSFGFP
jgi:hypothetical protein